MAAGQVALILLRWGLAQYPYLITFAGAAAPTSTLRLLTGELGVGALVLFPSFGYLFYVFKGQHDATELRQSME